MTLMVTPATPEPERGRRRPEPGERGQVTQPSQGGHTARGGHGAAGQYMSVEMCRDVSSGVSRGQ